MAVKITRLEDLARLAGVSTATVSRALNDSSKVNQETKRRVWRLAQEHDYSFRPNMPAIMSGADSTIAIVIPMHPGRDGKTSDPFYMELIGWVAEAAREVDCDIVISHFAPKNYDDLTHLVETNRSEGIIFLGQSFLHERFNRLVKHDGRFVVWGANLPGQQYCSVGSDNIMGGEKAVSHLLRLGRRKIVFLGDVEAPEFYQRYQGYMKAMEKADLSIDDRLISSAHLQPESAEAAVDAMIAGGYDFDAIFAASDLIAFGAIAALNRAGVKVPDDVAVIGYDNIVMGQYSNPPLTTISQDMMKAGRILVAKLLNAKSNKQLLSERLPTELIVRKSCGA